VIQKEFFGQLEMRVCQELKQHAKENFAIFGATFFIPMSLSYSEVTTASFFHIPIDFPAG
jgi:hypothetical protein